MAALTEGVAVAVAAATEQVTRAAVVVVAATEVAAERNRVEMAAGQEMAGYLAALVEAWSVDGTQDAYSRLQVVRRTLARYWTGSWSR